MRWIVLFQFLAPRFSFLHKCTWFPWLIIISFRICLPQKKGCPNQQRQIFIIAIMSSYVGFIFLISHYESAWKAPKFTNITESLRVCRQIGCMKSGQGQNLLKFLLGHKTAYKAHVDKRTFHLFPHWLQKTNVVIGSSALRVWTWEWQNVQVPFIKTSHWTSQTM